MLDPEMTAFDAKMAKHRDAVALLAAYSVNGTTPFSNSATDMVYHLLSTIQGLSIVVSNALDDSGDNGEGGTRPCHLARAVDAIDLLSSLAMFADEGRPR